MKFAKLNIIVFILFTSWVGVAQQLPQFTQYMFNTISINPAYAGSRETLSVVGLHRSQWVGLEGAPTTQTLSVHTPLRNEKIGLGLSFINDELGYQNFQYAYVDFSYTVQTDFRAAEFDDPVIYGYENRWKPNIGAGVYWHSNRWYLGLSAPRMLNTDYNGEQEFEALERLSYYFTGGYVFDLGGTTKFKPSYMLKATNGAPLSLDLTANFLFNEVFWLGGSYRFDEYTSAIGAIADFQVSKQLRIGYAYEYPFSDFRPYTSGTHEILLMFEIFKSKRIKSPRYF